jgi:hypothetical protein
VRLNSHSKNLFFVLPRFVGKSAYVECASSDAHLRMRTQLSHQSEENRFFLRLRAFALSLCVTLLGEQPMNRYRGKVNAPEFPVGLDWLNSQRPLSLTELRGKIVLLEFWTFC